MGMRCTGEKCPLKGLLEELQGDIQSCTAHNCQNRTVSEADDEQLKEG